MSVCVRQIMCWYGNIIYNETYQDHPQYSWEFWVGDGIYDSYALAISTNLTDFFLDY